jgi:hypothetical protein
MPRSLDHHGIPTGNNRNAQQHALYVKPSTIFIGAWPRQQTTAIHLMSAPAPTPAGAAPPAVTAPEFTEEQSLEEQFAAQEEYEAQQAAMEVAANAAKASSDAASSGATEASTAAAAKSAQKKKKTPWRLVVETIDKTDFKKPNIALFFNLFFSVFDEYVDMVESMNVEATVRWLECYWRDQLLNEHRALKVILVDNAWPSEELARIETQTKPRKRDPETLEYTDEIDVELETKRIRKAIECVYTAFSAHEVKIRARDADNLFMSWWGEVNDPDQKLRAGMPGFITWCTEQNWRKSWKADLDDSEQPPGTIEDVWFLLGQLDGEQDRLMDSISTIFLLSKTLKRLSPHGWECIFAILHRLLKSVRNNDKLSMKFLKKRISKLMSAGVENIAQNEKELVLDCIVGSTPVALGNGFSRPVSEVCAGTPVLSFDATHAGHVSRATSVLLVRGTRACVELLFSDGRTVTCTPNHRFLSSDGVTWISAGDMKVNTTEIMTGVEYPTELATDVPSTFTNGEDDWSLDLSTEGLLGCVLNLTDRKEHAIAFAGLLGYLLTDGNVSERGSALFPGHALDVAWIQRDIQLLTGKVMAATSGKKTWSVRIPMELHRAALFVGISTTDRISAVSTFPEFLFKPDCPRVIVQAFLGGLFGGDGVAPSLQWSQGTPVRFHEIGFCLSRAGSVWKEQKEQTTTDLQRLFDRLNIDASAFVGISSTNKPSNVDAIGREEVKRRKTNGQKLCTRAEDDLQQDASYSIVWSISLDALLLFHERIGFRYCCHKQTRLSATAAYYRQRDYISRQKCFLQNSIRAEERRLGREVAGGEELATFLEQAKTELSKHHVVHPLIINWRPQRKDFFRGARGAGMTIPEAIISFDIGKFFSQPRTGSRYKANLTEPVCLQSASGSPSVAAPPGAWSRRSSVPPSHNQKATAAVDVNTKRKAAGLGEDEPMDAVVGDKVTYGVHATATALPTFRVKLIGRRVVAKPLQTFDLTVPGTENFLAHGLVAHNCLQDTFLTLSMKMERMFKAFFAKIPAFVKAIFNKKLQRTHPNMSCEKFIDTTSHNLHLVRTFFQHARMHSLSRKALSAAILTKIKFTEKVDIDVETLKESAQMTVQRSTDATFAGEQPTTDGDAEEKKEEGENGDAEEEEEDGDADEVDEDEDPSLFDFSHLRINGEVVSAAAAAAAPTQAASK